MRLPMKRYVTPFNGFERSHFTVGRTANVRMEIGVSGLSEVKAFFEDFVDLGLARQKGLT